MLGAGDAEGIKAFPGKGSPAAHEEGFRRLRAEVMRLRRERDILKKALAFFAGDTTSSDATGADDRSG